MMQTIRLIATLAALWLLLSGYFKTQMLVLGVLCVILVAFLAFRMRVIEHQEQPIYFRFWGVVGYWGWLFWQIILSNIDVTKRVWTRQLDIKPALRPLTVTPATEMGRVIYANSITLTPGTTAINFTPDDQILVHALHQDSLAELEQGEMVDRIRKIEPYLMKKPGDFR